MAIHDYLKQQRTAKGMTQAEVAQQLGVTRQAVSSYESGRTQPDLETLKRMAEIYGVDVRDVLCGGKQTISRQRLVKAAAIAAAAVLWICSLVHSLLLWVGDRWFPVAAGQLSSEQMEAIRTRFRLMDIAEGVEGFSLAMVGLLLLALLGLLTATGDSVPAKVKVGYLLVLTMGTALLVLPWALTSSTTGTANYLITPVRLLMRSAVFLAVSLLIDLIRKYKK